MEPDGMLQIDGADTWHMNVLLFRNNSIDCAQRKFRPAAKCQPNGEATENVD